MIFTHIVSFQRDWRAAVVSQELCDLLSQAGREQGRGVRGRVDVSAALLL